MNIARVGASAVEATSITIPGTYQAGDLIMIYAFRSVQIAPTAPAGWTVIGTGSVIGSSYTLAWKLAASASDTSGTWTNATGLICHVLRNTATNKVPVNTNIGTTTNTGTTVTYTTLMSPILKAPTTSWLVAFAATKITDSSLQTPPTDMTNCATLVGGAAEYACHDTNGPYIPAAWPSTAVVVGGTSAEWRTAVVEILAEQGVPNNFRFVNVGNGMSAGERIY